MNIRIKKTQPDTVHISTSGRLAMNTFHKDFKGKGHQINWRLVGSQWLHIPFTSFREFIIPETLYSFFNIVDEKIIDLCFRCYTEKKNPLTAPGKIHLINKKMVLSSDERLRRVVQKFRTYQPNKGDAVLIISNLNKKEEYGVRDGKPVLCDVYNIDVQFLDKSKNSYSYQMNNAEVDNNVYESSSNNKIANLPLDNKSVEMPFGHIDGIKEGQIFANRKELGLSGIHKPSMHGIWGRESEGSASIVISGGYADDIDEGDYILYTGQGGQDTPGGKQIKDQEFTRGNRGLQVNKEYNLPVRVTRGYQVENGPDEGYRYDGLYYVTDYERVEGKEGFLICRFHLQKENITSVEGIEEPTSPADRVPYSGDRLKRNVKFAEQIKKLYNNTCQVCNKFLKTPMNGFGISEAAHIKAIGRPHNGPDNKANMLCLCPNHHAQFDNYSFYIEPENFEIVGLDEYEGQPITKKHKINAKYFEYHKEQYLKKN